MHIIVKKNASHSLFQRHYNRALGKFYHTKQDYLRDMKDMGCEPYNPSKVTVKQRKSYKPSEWAHAMINAVNYDKNKKPIIGDKWKDELVKSGMRSAEDAVKKIGRTKLNNMAGGFLDAE